MASDNYSIKQEGMAEERAGARIPEAKAAAPEQVVIPARELLGALGDRLAEDLLISPAAALRALCQSQAVTPATKANLEVMAQAMEEAAMVGRAAMQVMQDPRTGDLVFRKI